MLGSLRTGAEPDMVIDDEQGWLPATASQPGGDGTRGLPLLWGEGQLSLELCLRSTLQNPSW